jgi:hypothetical protein
MGWSSRVASLEQQLNFVACNSLASFLLSAANELVFFHSLEATQHFIYAGGR